MMTLHCDDCGKPLTDVDLQTAAVRAAEMRSEPDPDDDVFCAVCQDARDGAAYDRKQEDDFAAYHGGGSWHDASSLLADMQDARKLK